jgi:putative DNA primase/helicase
MIEQFKLAMQTTGIKPPNNIIANSKLHRFHIEGDRASSKNGFYVFFDDVVPAGHFGCHKRSIAQNWCSKNINQLTDSERSAYHQSMAKAKAERETLDAESHHRAMAIANKRVNNSKKIVDGDSTHRYLAAKNIKAYGIFTEGENILIPLRDANGNIWSTQLISPDGKLKILQKEGCKTGKFHLLGKEIKDNGFNQVAILTEGYSTGATVYDAIDQNHAVIVCFGSGNFEAVALALREKYPRLKILITGDNDAFQKNNSGKESAKKAFNALKGGTGYLIPDFLSVTEADIADRFNKSLVDSSLAFFGTGKNKQQTIDAIKKDRLPEYERLKPTDFNDMAQWLGVERVRNQIKNAMDQIGLITVEGGKLPQIIKQIENEMLFAGGNLYQRAGALVRAIHTEKAIDEKGVKIPANSLTIHAINEQWLTHHFTKIAKWRKYDGRSESYKYIDAEPKYSSTYFSLVGDWNLPILRGITECPTLRRDGSLIRQCGYDKASGLYIDYQGEKVNVIDQPTKQDALDAIQTLKLPLKDFPFLAEIDRSVILAAMLTSVVNFSLPTTPWFAIDAPIKGSGKSLLADIVAMISTGRKAIIISQGYDETEDEKRIGALLMRGVPLMNLDNIERPVGGDMLCSITTQAQYSIRPLGQSKLVDLPTNVTKLATGNNLIFKGDMTRRVLLCQLDPQCERPDARSFDVDLNQWIPENRHKLLCAALTVLRAYICAGKPKQNITAYGGFDDWNNLIRAALIWLDIADPMESRERLENSDPIKNELGAVLPLWFGAFGDKGKTTAEIVELCESTQYADLKYALMDIAVNKRGDAIDHKRLGNWLKKYQNRVDSGFRFEQSGKDSYTKRVFWRVSKISNFTGSTVSDLLEFTKTANIEKDNYSNISENRLRKIPQIPKNEVEEF